MELVQDEGVYLLHFSCFLHLALRASQFLLEPCKSSPALGTVLLWHEEGMATLQKMSSVLSSEADQVQRLPGRTGVYLPIH